MKKDLLLKYLQSIFEKFTVKVVAVDNIDNYIIANIIAEYTITNSENEILENLQFSLKMERQLDDSWLFVPNFENINYHKTINQNFEVIRLDIKKQKLAEIVSIVRANEPTIMNNLLNFMNL